MKVEVIINDELYNKLNSVAKLQGWNFSDVMNDALHREYERMQTEAANKL